MALTVIVAYDVGNNRRRTRLANYLQGWGYRMQESVFQLRLSNEELSEVCARINKLISETDDVVHVYPLCAACCGHAEVFGTAPALDDVGLCSGVW